ncbi:Hypothetical_protein [Hexamita inflata]|uniref:Hypothetical_protein n=1 Tax=Hexamita inflata TaxID=28002 RepID=A0AA86P9E5_9EUKA|nr:Hypothetical protein HINF_LOCUS21995 [Hexamita inflata]CAI9952126.1 Hypothetical protein HINF_LOCUS39771 [Hexamita inflata]
MSVDNENTVKKSLNDYKAEKKRLKEQQEVIRQEAAQKGKQTYYSNEYKTLCENQQQEILQLKIQQQQQSQLIFDLQQQLKYHQEQHNPHTSAQTQTEQIEQPLPDPQILQEYPEQQQEVQNPQLISDVFQRISTSINSQNSNLVRKTRLIEFLDLAQTKFILKNSWTCQKYKLWTNQANTHIKL